MIKIKNSKLILCFTLYSDGGGRSGVYLAIDANMELAEEEDCFHVFGYLKKLRQSRKGLIENVVRKFYYNYMCISIQQDHLSYIYMQNSLEFSFICKNSYYF